MGLITLIRSARNVAPQELGERILPGSKASALSAVQDYALPAVRKVRYGDSLPERISPFIRFTSLVVELIRARPRLVVWIAALSQAALWLFVALLFYRSPPGNLATLLAFGREYQVGTDLGPPLSFWLADIAYRLAGNHMIGVYLLSRLCDLATLWILYLLARAVGGGQHAALAVLLTITITAFGAPGLEFGPMVAARPIWALLLLHSWQLIGRGRRNAWFAWSIEAGLLLLTTPAAIILLLLIVGFAVGSERGRRTLMSVDALFALLVICVLALPYFVWLLRAGEFAFPLAPAFGDLKSSALHWLWLLGGLLSATAGILALVLLDRDWFGRKSEEAPIIFRPPVEPLARHFIYFFAVAPALAGSLISGVFRLDQIVGGPGVALLLVGLAVIVATGDFVALRRPRLLRTVWAAVIAAPALVVVVTTLLLPWTAQGEVATSLPASAIGHFFTDSFERRTNQRLRAVAGDAQLAALVSLGPGRPQLFLDATPQRTPWQSIARFNETGGVVVWRALDTAGTPPAEIAQRFPGLVPEVPRAFEWLINGRQPLMRIGWAIVRPKAP